MAYDPFPALESTLEGVLRRSPSSNWAVRAFHEVGSTMDEARASLELVEGKDGVLFLAETQRSGRGRQGRQWSSGKGGFFGTYLFRTSEPLSHLAGFSLAVGWVICDALALPPEKAGLKWPNDILSVDGKKLGGILIELISRGEWSYVLVGVGLNLSRPPGDVEHAASLSEVLGEVLTPVSTAALLSEPLRDCFRLVSKSGFASYRERWLERALFLGEPVRIDTGSEIVAGTFEGVSPNGSIILSEHGTRRELASGHVVSGA